MKKVILFLVLFLVPFFVLAEESHESTLIPSASSGVLMEASTGEIVFSKDMYMEVPVASMTKMVAQILILEAIRDQTISWDDIVTVSQNAADMGGSQIYLSAGEKISIRDLMKGISMASANDATVMMAEVLGGSEKGFVNMMNRKVKELGLEHTHFVNSTGLDEEGHYSCSYDMAVIARELITKYPEILEFSSVYEDYLREDTENKFWLVNTNKLARFYEGADGLKTGHTDAAKYCLAATAKKDDLRFIAIVLGEENSNIRNQETMNLLDYGFQNYNIKILKEKGEVIKKVSVDKASEDSIYIVPVEDVGVLEEKSKKNSKYTIDVKLNKIKLPVKKGDVVGKVIVKDDQKKIREVDVTTRSNVYRYQYLDLLLEEIKIILSGDISY